MIAVIEELMRQESEARERFLREELARRGLTIEELARGYELEVEPAEVRTLEVEGAPYTVSMVSRWRLRPRPEFLDAGEGI